MVSAGAASRPPPCPATPGSGSTVTAPGIGKGLGSLQTSGIRQCHPGRRTPWAFPSPTRWSSLPATAPAGSPISRGSPLPRHAAGAARPAFPLGGSGSIRFTSPARLHQSPRGHRSSPRYACRSCSTGLHPSRTSTSARPSDRTCDVGSSPPQPGPHGSPPRCSRPRRSRRAVDVGGESPSVGAPSFRAPRSWLPERRIG